MLATCILNSLFHDSKRPKHGDRKIFFYRYMYIGAPLLKYLINELMRSISHQTTRSLAKELDKTSGPEREVRTIGQQKMGETEFSLTS